MVVKAQTSAPKAEPKKPGNIYDAFAKKMLGRVLVFVDFLLSYADQQFVDEIDLTQIQRRRIPGGTIAVTGNYR